MKLSSNRASEARQTIVILSRGVRLAMMFREVALALSRDYHVVVVMYDEAEQAIWRGTKGIECIDLAARIKEQVDCDDTRLAARTREIERTIDVPLYRAASNYLLYRRFAKDYYGEWPPFYDTERHMMEEYVGSYGALVSIFDEYRPILVLHEAIDLITTFIALAIARSRGIFNIGLMFAAGVGEGKIILFYGLQRKNFICTHLMRQPHLITDECRVRARSLIAKTREQGIAPVSHVEVRRAALTDPKRAMRQLVGNGALRHPRLLIERIHNWRWLYRHLRRDIPADPFILFLMHLQPEASTASQAPRWVDQDRVIEQLAINAPQGMRIVVKENPQCFGWRGERYYGRLTELENVHLAHPLVPTHELLQRAQALVTITGSAGLEAILLGTRVAVLGRPYYADFSGVRLLDAPEQVFVELSDPSWQTDSEIHRETYVAAYLQSLHYIGEVMPGRKWPAPEVMGSNLAGAIRRTLSFIETYGLTPSQFDSGLGLARAAKPTLQTLAQT